PESDMAAPVRCSTWFVALQGIPAPLCQELGLPRLCSFFYLIPGVRYRCPLRFWCCEPTSSARWFDWAGERFRPTRLVTAACRVQRGRGGSRWDGWCPLPTPLPDALRPGWPLPKRRRIRCPGSPFLVRAAHQTLVSTSPRPAQWRWTRSRAVFFKVLAAFDLTCFMQCPAHHPQRKFLGRPCGEASPRNVSGRGAGDRLG